MMRNRTINFAKSDARPEDIKGTIGVSDRFADPKLKEAIEEQLRSEQPMAPEQEEAAMTSSENAEEASRGKRDVDDVLTEIAGTAGRFMRIPRAKLLPTPEEWTPSPRSRGRRKS